MNERLPSPQEFVQIWLDGGWLMIPLFILTIFLYYQAFALINYLNKTKVNVSRSTWTDWIRNPQKGTGFIGQIIAYIVAQGYETEEIVNRVEQVKLQIIPEVNQKIILLGVLVTVSPLMGLLGTVIGMLTTFQGLAASAGEQTVNLVADGISVALITTQTGLMIAIPGYIFISMIIKRRNEFVGFLSQAETIAIQEGTRIDTSSQTA